MSRRKKVALIVGVVCVMAGALTYVMLISPWLAERRFDRAVEELRKRGEPVTMPELEPPEIPDEENAAVPYAQAFVLLDQLPDGTAGRIEELAREKKVHTAEELAEARGLLEGAGEILKLLGEGAKRRGCRYALDYTLSGSERQVPRQIHSAGRLLVLSAKVKVSEGRIDEAIEDCERIAALGRSVRGTPAWNALYVEVATEWMKLKGMRGILEGCEPSAEQIGRMREVLGKPDERERLIFHMKIMRVWGLDTIREVKDDPNYLRKWGIDETNSLEWFMRSQMGFSGHAYECPRRLWMKDAPGALELMDRSIELARKPYHESSEGWKVIAEEVSGGGGPCRRPAAQTMVGDWASTWSAAAMFDPMGASRAMGELALALRLYRMKRGRYPETLGELVPEYVKDLPIDPFSGKGFVYRREGAGFIVYSVGENMVDDGGEWDRQTEKDDVAWKCGR